MRSAKIWGLIVASGTALTFLFSNCSQTQFKKVELASDSAGLSTPVPEVPLLTMNCNDEKKRDGEVWMSAIDQERETLACKVGTGEQIQVYDVSKELRCANGLVIPTGKNERVARQIEGLCNLDCGNYKNGDKWYIDAGQQRDNMVCKVGTGNQFQVYNLSKEVTCVNAITTETGVVKKEAAALEGLCNLDCGERKNGEKWLVGAGQDRTIKACTVGTGNQTEVVNLSKQYTCVNAVTSETGVVQRDAAGLEGMCNVDCGDHKNGDKWLVAAGQERNIMACTVGIGNQFQVFNLSKQFACVNAVTSETGVIDKALVGLEGMCNLACGDHQNGEKWFEGAGQTREGLTCKVGTGEQTQVYDLSKEFRCENAVKFETGIVRKVAATVEGACNLDCGTHKNGEKWLVSAGQSREGLTCTVGTGEQTQVYNLSKELSCLNAITSETGIVQKVVANIEGVCNLDCGARKNGELWWNTLPGSTETTQCPTSLTATSTLSFSNSAEYKCTNAVTSATGNLLKTKVNETACPPMTFNSQDNQATLAFEDIYPNPLDSDYNDFVTNIKVSETYNSLGELTRIELEYALKDTATGLPQKLIAVFDGIVRGRDGWVSNLNSFKSEPMFNGEAKIQYELFKGGVFVSSKIVPKNLDLVVFERPRIAPPERMVAKITVTDIDGKLNLLSNRKGVNIKRYRTLLYIPNSTVETLSYSVLPKYDIDISDINPNSYDNVGRPLGFFVPVNWRTVKETIKIESAYPDFQAHADFLKSFAQNPNLVEPDKAKNWFNNVILQYVD